MMKRTLHTLALTALLRALPGIIKIAARRDKRVRDHLVSSDCVVQIRLRDGSCARHYIFHRGSITARGGTHKSPDVDMVFKTAAVALSMMRPDPDYAVVIDALKNFKVTAGRSEEHTSELQSQSNLVCRLLLEKKKKNKNRYFTASITTTH